MLINALNTLTEISFYLLIFGVTFSNSATEIFTISLIALFIIKKIVSKEYRLPKTPVNIFLYALCAVIFVTFLRSAYFSESVRGLIKIVKYIFLFFALSDYFSGDRDRINRAFRAIMVIGCITFLNGVFQSFSGYDILRHNSIMKDDHLRRIQGAFVHPNDFGAYIIFILPLTLCFFSPFIKKGERAFLLLNCILGAYCLLKTSSRGAFLGLVIGVILYFFFYKKRISVIIPLTIILFVILLPNGLDRLKSLFTLERNTVWERMQLWKGTWEMIKVHPFLGFGINTFSKYFPQYKPSDYWGIMYTHNSYLQMWSEIGILGLAAFLSAIFVVLKRILQDLSRKIKSSSEGFVLLGALAGYVAFLLQSGLDTNLYSLRLTTLFWAMTAYMLSVNKVLEE